MDTPAALLKPEEAAELLRVSRPTIYRLIQSGSITAIRLGGERGSFRIERSELEDFISRNRGVA